MLALGWLYAGLGAGAFWVSAGSASPRYRLPDASSGRPMTSAAAASCSYLKHRAETPPQLEGQLPCRVADRRQFFFATDVAGNLHLRLGI